ncbi:MAG: hypothetical protein J7518_03530 [Nocardioidaceae bacterium]|nr:hypothetical protein [Nocardioidaceae bacterium]
MPSPSRILRLALAAAITGACVTGTLAGPATALSARVADPSTSPASADVTGVRYIDGEGRTVTRVHVRRLPRAGSVLVRIGPASGVPGYVAHVTRTRAGVLTTALTRDGSGVACHLDATWSRAANLVQVTVPQSCLDFGRFLVKHRFQAVFRAAAGTDRAPARIVGRGDSPGCVTAAESAALRLGQRMDAVHARFDTAGVPEPADPGTALRSYRGCAPGTDYEVQYAAGAVVGWTVLGGPPVA